LTHPYAPLSGARAFSFFAGRSLLFTASQRTGYGRYDRLPSEKKLNGIPPCAQCIPSTIGECNVSSFTSQSRNECSRIAGIGRAGGCNGVNRA
jgi:hypothetical protein